jgi:hypothetical protein
MSTRGGPEAWILVWLKEKSYVSLYGFSDWIFSATRLTFGNGNRILGRNLIRSSGFTGRSVFVPAFLMNRQLAWPGSLLRNEESPGTIFGTHFCASMALNGNVQQWPNGFVGTRCCSLMTSDHILVTMTYVMLREEHLWNVSALQTVKVKVKQSRYTPWRRLGGEEV